MPAPLIGHIKQLRPTFGFITDVDDTDWFFHRTDLASIGGVFLDQSPADLSLVLQEGQMATFQPEQTAKGPRALLVRVQTRQAGS